MNYYEFIPPQVWNKDNALKTQYISFLPFTNDPSWQKRSSKTKNPLTEKSEGLGFKPRFLGCELDDFRQIIQTLVSSGNLLINEMGMIPICLAPNQAVERLLGNSVWRCRENRENRDAVGRGSTCAQWLTPWSHHFFSGSLVNSLSCPVVFSEMNGYVPVFAFPYLYSILVSSLFLPTPGILRRSWNGTLPSLSFRRGTGCTWRALWTLLLPPRMAPAFSVFFPTHLSLSPPNACGNCCSWTDMPIFPSQLLPPCYLSLTNTT